MQLRIILTGVVSLLLVKAASESKSKSDTTPLEKEKNT